LSRPLLLLVENTNIIAEMDAKFETVKKDAQIKVLNTNAKLDRLKNGPFGWGNLDTYDSCRHNLWNVSETKTRSKCGRTRKDH
jgi:hypothetical protein